MSTIGQELTQGRESAILFTSRQCVGFLRFSHFRVRPPPGTFGHRVRSELTHNRKKCKHLSASIRVWFEPVKTARIKRLRA